MGTYPFAKKELTLHLARGEGRERLRRILRKYVDYYHSCRTTYGSVDMTLPVVVPIR